MSPTVVAPATGTLLRTVVHHAVPGDRAKCTPRATRTPHGRVRSAVSGMFHLHERVGAGGDAARAP
jgi:hypothetical protein